MDIPELPTQCRTGLIGDYVDLMYPTTMAPWALHFGAFLTCFGATFADVFVAEGTYEHRPTFFTVITGPTGRAKKTTVNNAALKLFDDLRLGDHRPKLCPSNGSWQGMLQSLIDVGRKQLSGGEATDLGISEDRPNWSVGVPSIIQAPEAAALIDQGKGTSRNSRGNGQDKFLIRVYDQPRSLSNVTVGRGRMELFHPRAALLGDSTPEALTRALEGEDAESGFFNRFSFFVVSGEGVEYISTPPRPDPGRYDRLLNRIVELRANIPHGQELAWSDDARDRLDDIGRAQFDKMDSGESGLVARMEGQLKRVAMVYALQDGRITMDAQDVDLAQQVVDYLTGCALYLGGQIEQGTLAKFDAELIAVLRRCGPLRAGEVGAKINSTSRGKANEKGWKPKGRLDYLVNNHEVRPLGDGRYEAV